jgi:hypothetical protein
MAPSRPDPLGERLSGLEATVASMDKYAHSKWHDLNNTLQPLTGLPLQLSREIAKMQGTFDGRMSAITRDMERSITAAVEKAIEPVNTEIATLKAKVEALEQANFQEAGAKGLAAAIMRSPIVSVVIGSLLAALAVAWAFVNGKVP